MGAAASAWLRSLLEPVGVTFAESFFFEVGFLSFPALTALASVSGLMPKLFATSLTGVSSSNPCCAASNTEAVNTAAPRLARGA